MAPRKPLEEMQSQDEKMRQNMEESSATQQEMKRKEQEYIAQIDRLETELPSTAIACFFASN